MGIGTIILWVIVIIEAIAIYLLYYHFDQEVRKLFTIINHMDKDHKISDAFHNINESDDLHKITNDLFKTIKKRFQINAHSYSELIEKLKMDDDIDENLREDLINFFDSMILIDYKKDGGDKNKQKANMKSKLKKIMEKLEV